MVDAEWALVGGLLLDSSRLSEIDVAAADFCDETNRAIFAAICELAAASEVADIITVSDRLETQTGRRGWLATVGTIAKNTPGTANLAGYAKAVREASRKRQAKAVAERLSGGISGGLSAIDAAIRDLMAIDTARKSYDCSVTQALMGTVEMIDVASQAKGMMGIPTGLRDLDACIGGFQKTDLYIIGARPSVGKTAFMLNCMSATDRPIGMISSEQGRDQIGLRLIAINGKVSARRMRTADLDDAEWARLTRSVETLSAKRVWINDQPAPSIEEVIRQARKWKFQHAIEGLYVDYVQRLKGPHGIPRHQEVGHIVMGLKELARELEIPVIALSQVNRDVEERNNKRPYLSDLKDSGTIEQEADVVMTLYRDEVYDKNTDAAGMVEVAVLKNRHGPTGMVPAVWNAEYMRFEDFANDAA